MAEDCVHALGGSQLAYLAPWHVHTSCLTFTDNTVTHTMAQYSTFNIMINGASDVYVCQ